MEPTKDIQTKLQAEDAELAKQLADPAVVANQQELARVAKRQKIVGEQLALLEAITESQRKIAELKELQASEQDEAIQLMAAEELPQHEGKLLTARQAWTEATAVRDERDERPAIVEIRAGAGGDEASLFAKELYGMYQRYAENRGWKAELLTSSPSDAGGFKEVILMITGDGAFGALKYEAGTHRVQRVPVTESSGRIHTSTVTVAVLPEAEEQEYAIKPEELRIDVFRSSGPGGQSVNTTDSAVRITHLPSGVVVTCQDEKSQHKNRAKAMQILRARLKAAQDEAAAKERGDARRAQVGTGERSEKIRTYNFPQDRVTDHRIGLTTGDLKKVLAGGLQPIIDALMQAAAKTEPTS